MCKRISKKRLLCGHLERYVIKTQYVTSPIIDLYEYQIILISCSRWPHSNRLYTSVSSKFVCALSTIFVFTVTYIYCVCYNVIMLRPTDVTYLCHNSLSSSYNIDSIKAMIHELHYQ